MYSFLDIIFHTVTCVNLFFKFITDMPLIHPTVLLNDYSSLFPCVYTTFFNCQFSRLQTPVIFYKRLVLSLRQ